MKRGVLITAVVATAYTLAALIYTLLPPLDFLDSVRGGVYTAYFPWGLVSADGSHAYAEFHGYKIAVNLWKVVICDPSGVCRSQEINAIAMYLGLKASGALAVESTGQRCYAVKLRPTEFAGHVISFDGEVCLNPDGSPRRISGVLTLDGKTWRLADSPQRVDKVFLFDSYYKIHGD
ncbi:MAG: hypothetical protein ACPL3C_10795 [Pyrobaculum sp.]